MLIFRCTTLVGVSVEFVAATAWLAELFAERKQERPSSDYAGVFVYRRAAHERSELFESDDRPFAAGIHGGHEAWRYTVLWGILPAIPLLVVRPFLPESPIWLKKKRRERSSGPALWSCSSGIRKTALLTCLMMACA